MLRPLVVFDLDHTLITPTIRELYGIGRRPGLARAVREAINVGQPYPDSASISTTNIVDGVPSAAPDMRVINSPLTWLPQNASGLHPHGTFDIYMRPWTRRLLLLARERGYRIGIWTFSGSKYARPIVEKVLGLGPADLEFLYTYDNPPPGWTRKTDGKPLEYIVQHHGGPAVIVEDTPQNCLEDPEQCLIVSRHDCLECPPDSACARDGSNCATTDNIVRRLRNLVESVRTI